MAALFSPFELAGATLRNRIVVSPMCQYAAIEGTATEWHRVHYASLARGGAAVVTLEATAVSPEGRITQGCAGLWTSAQAEALIPIVRSIKITGALPGIQLAHSGRKGSAHLPWEGDDHMRDDDPLGWQTISASAIAAGGSLSRKPRAMTVSDIARVQSDFVSAAVRARDCGFEWLELHFAHGYLAMNFLSTYSNERCDQYGGSSENQNRFLLETVAAVRDAWPANRPLAVRLGAVEYDGNDEENILRSIELGRQLKNAGVDLIDVSLGLSIQAPNIPWETPAFLTPIAHRIRTEVGIPVMTSFKLDNPETADRAVATGQLDLVAIATGMLANPHWPYYAARKLRIDQPFRFLPVHYAHWLKDYDGV